jgi:hypothetical protein
MKAKIFLGLGSLLLLVALVVMLGCEGSEGPAGLTGKAGNSGGNGEDWAIPVPEDRIFSTAFFNGRHDAHNGNAVILLTSDEDADLDGNTVIMDSIDRPPRIDGYDDGDAIWGGLLTPIVLGRTGEIDNYITSAWIRAAYDKDYFYLLIRWKEIAEEDFQVGVDDEFRTWTYELIVDVDSTGVDSTWTWVRSSDADDRVAVFWLIEPSRFEDEVAWGIDGCRIACHAGNQGGMYTPIDTTQLDVWSWGAVTTDPTGYAVDAFISSAPIPNAFRFDAGDRVWLDNTTDTVPILPLVQHKMDPNSDAQYPLMIWEIQGFDEDADWDLGATIPGVVSSYPSYSAGDILAKGHFEDGFWTVEFRRIRDTGNIDDIVF